MHVPMCVHAQVFPYLEKVLALIGKLQLVTSIAYNFVLPESDTAVCAMLCTSDPFLCV
jgi:hypothetical protein